MNADNDSLFFFFNFHATGESSYCVTGVSAESAGLRAAYSLELHILHNHLSNMFPKSDEKMTSLLHRRPNFDTLDLNIRTLSCILHKMSAADAPSSTRGDVPTFLRDMATLLTRRSSTDREGKQVVAFTGIIREDGVTTLVVTENSPNAIQNQAQPFSLEFVPVAKTPGTFHEIFET